MRNSESCCLAKMNLGPTLPAWIFYFCMAIQVSGQDNAQLTLAQAPKTIKITDKIPYGREPIDYFSERSDDAVTKLNHRLISGDVSLEFDQRHGYLRAALRELEVPIESQLLVFSKTARNPSLVSPQTPRAIYFNDSVTVAWIPEAKEIELTALDPLKGANFYTLSQVKKEVAENVKQIANLSRSQNNRPNEHVLQLIRRDRCLACHSGRSSLDIPGYLVRGFQTDKTGKPLFGFSRVTDEKKLADRFGGWFVTGSPLGIVHRGNLFGQDDNQKHKQQHGFKSAVTDLSELQVGRGYLSSTSDFVAHMVLVHQMHGLNLMIRANLEARLGRRSDVEEQLVDYLVFKNAAPLAKPLRQSNSQEEHAAKLPSKYAEWFQNQGQRDKQGRSLRDFDLTTRVFQYRLSFLVETEFFDRLEPQCANRIYRKLWEGLTSSDKDRAFQHLPAEEKQAIIEIIASIKPKRPSYWVSE